MNLPGDAEDSLPDYSPDRKPEFDESSALEEAILEGVHSPHREYGEHVLDAIREAAR
jgi:hypothetical protein